jgi:tRNA (mo5U34)-methyltransferase
MWGIIPAAGVGSRIQPLAFSKELLPVGSRLDGDVERPRAVSEYLVERMVLAGARKLCFVIAPGKSDILDYYGGAVGRATVTYVVQPRAAGLCDAVFRALPLVEAGETVAIGLPDTIWFPDDGLCSLPEDRLSFLLFPVEHPEFFDAVVAEESGRVQEIQVKQRGARSNWIWGAFKMPGSVLRDLFELWCRRGREDEYFGTLVNAYLKEGGEAVGVRAGTAYVDVGTLHGYREAIHLLDRGNGALRPAPAPASRADERQSGNGSSAALNRADGGARTREQIERRVRALAPWFHNMDLGGVWTAPDHFLGDYPALKWNAFKDALPADLSGRTVLDIGCNAGFYSIQMKRRGAHRVVGIDSDEHYLAQARFAAEVSRTEIEFRQLTVYDVAKLGEKFDVVLFMGVLYHLRHPLLALDLIHDNAAAGLLVFQSMQRGSRAVAEVGGDYTFWQSDQFDDPGYPRLHFVERKYCGDETNWWVPNRACVEAMLRSSGFEMVAHPEDEVYVCRRTEIPDPPDGPRAVYPARGAARHA